jgi:hypothetical protein
MAGLGIGLTGAVPLPVGTGRYMPLATLLAAQLLRPPSLTLALAAPRFGRGAALAGGNAGLCAEGTLLSVLARAALLGLCGFSPEG